jgi:hypothetical protein
MASWQSYLIKKLTKLLWVMGGVSSKTTSHITRVLDLTYFSRSQRSKFETKVNLFCHYLTWKVLTGPKFSRNVDGA